MGLGNDLRNEVRDIFRTSWNTRDGRTVPEAEDVRLGNDAVKIDAAVLYADMDGSTDLVDRYYNWFAAEVYKAYLHCAAKIIRSEGGHIRSYDGDRIMGIFIGDTKCADAARCGLKISYAVSQIINPAIANKFPDSPYEVKQVVGIDTSGLFAARTGIRGSNDLVWVGRAANYAAKLTEQSSWTPTWITADVYNQLTQRTTIGNDGNNMWSYRTWNAMSGMTVYCSNYWWEVV